MKNSTRQQKKRKQLTDKTRWAYFMQAIEPKSEKLNELFPGYHPLWVQQSQAITIGPENIKMMRLTLGMNVSQCAAYLRVDRATVTRWEKGTRPIPFAVFELMRLVHESLAFRLSHKAWDGWFISKDGALMSPDFGRAGYTPDQLNLYTLKFSENAWLKSEVERLQTGLNEAIVENTRLRQLFLSQGVTDELWQMQDRLTSLLNSIGTAHVIPFPTVENQQVKEKVA